MKKQLNVMQNIKTLVNDYDPFSNRKAVSKKLVKKWSQLGLTEGIKDQHFRETVALLIENQARQLVREMNSTSTQQNHEEWSAIALPLVRRTLEKISVKDYLSIQAMTYPSGLVFFMDFKYDTAQRGGIFNTGSVYGTKFVGDSGSAYMMMDTDASGGMYGVGKFGYSLNDVSSSITSSISGSVTGKDVNFATTSTGSLKKVIVPISSLSNPDLYGARVFAVTHANIDTIYPQFTRVVGNNIEFIVSGSVATGSVVVNTYYHKQPTASDRGDYEYKGSSNLHLGSMKMDIVSKPIVAETRKMDASWTPQLAQDLNAYQNIDAQAQITNQLSDELAVQTDMELLDMIMTSVQSDMVEYWSATAGNEYNPSTNAFSKNSTWMLNSQPEWFKTIVTKMTKISNKIRTKTLKSGANFAVCSPAVATILESIPGYVSDPSMDSQNFGVGVTKIGSFANKFNIWVNPYMKENVILMGRKGAGVLDTGAVFAPYIPVMMSPTVIEPTNYTPRKMIMTRYAKTMVRADYYGAIVVDGLDSI